ncbi:MAG: glycosyltransferase family 2 protein [Verrucomicrobiales bacterium]
MGEKLAFGEALGCFGGVVGGETIQLMVVMPVFNEEASVRKVVTEWFPVLDRVVGSFVLLAIDDGSSDGTPDCLRELKEELGAKFEWIRRGNRGHGQTCLEGYRCAMERGIPFVHQIDSDGQCDPVYFEEFWSRREDFEVIYGRRIRADGFRRVVASGVLRVALQVLAGVSCVDPNVPYRLMQTRACGSAIQAIPRDFFLANVALAVVLRRTSGLRHGSVPIRFLPRYGGEPSVPFSKFAVKAVELFRQLRSLDR